MKTFNKVLLIGHVGEEPSIKQLENNLVAKFSLATENSFINKDGEKVKEVFWHTIVCWNSLANIIENYVKKGSLLHIEGKLKYRKYTDKNEMQHISAEIIADQIILLNKQEK